MQLMVSTTQAQQMLELYGPVCAQFSTDWQGDIPLPPAVEQFYQAVGPVNLCLGSESCSFFLPSLERLWSYQSGYRWNAVTGEPVPGWQPDWLVVADHNGDPLVFTANGSVGWINGLDHPELARLDHAGESAQIIPLFPDLTTMAICLGGLGIILREADSNFWDETGGVSGEYWLLARSCLMEWLRSEVQAELVLDTLGWA